MNSVGKAMADIAPDVAKATLAAVQLNGIANLLIGIIGSAIIITFMYKVGILLWNTAKNGSDDTQIVCSMIGAIGGLVITMVLFMTVLWRVLTVEYWIAAFSPEAGLAYKVLEKVL